MTAKRLYAEGTEVAVTKSQQEIAALAERYGATGYMMGWQGERAVVEFMAYGRRVRFVLNLAVAETDPLIRVTRNNVRRTADGIKKAKESEVKRRWRTLALAIKAKFDVVESGISTFEEEFLAHVVLPGGTTVGEEITPGVERMYVTGQVTPLLELGGG